MSADHRLWLALPVLMILRSLADLMLCWDYYGTVVRVKAHG